MDWRIKALALRGFDALPFGAAVYRFIQRCSGSIESSPMTRLPMFLEMVGHLRSAGQDIQGRSVFEIGTGHLPVIPLLCFLCGASNVCTIDLNRRLDWASTAKMIRWFSDNWETVEAHLGSVVRRSELRNRFQRALHDYAWPEACLQKARIDYEAPADASKTGLAAESVDIVTSTTVLEHISSTELRKILLESCRILKPTGVAVHTIDLSDHFHHSDTRISPVNFLKYSESRWLRIAGNQFAYCNRLRIGDYLAMFQDAGFVALAMTERVDQKALVQLNRGFPLDHAFSGLPPEALAVTRLAVVLKKNRAI